MSVVERDPLGVLVPLRVGSRFDPDATAHANGNGEEPPIPDEIAPDAQWRPGLSTSTWAMLERLAAEDPPTAIVEGLIDERERALLYGYSSVGKSIFARELALAVHRGASFLEQMATTRRRVGIIDEESPAHKLGEQLVKVARAHGLDGGSDDLPVFAVMQGARLDTPAGVKQISAWIEENALGVLIVDTLIRAHRLRENEAEDMAKIDEALRALQAAASQPLTIVLVHHAPKPRENSSNDAATMARGSSDLFASADSAIYLRRGREAGQLIVEHAKARWSELRPSFLLKLESDAETLRLAYVGGVDQVSGLLDRAIEVALEALREGPKSRAELVTRGKAAKVSARTIDAALGKLVDDGQAARSRQGRSSIYSLTEGGLLLS